VTRPVKKIGTAGARTLFIDARQLGKMAGNAVGAIYGGLVVTNGATSSSPPLVWW
jgi:hypothetical protein